MEENKDVNVETAQQTEEQNNDQTPPAEKTYTRDEINKMIAAEKAKQQAEWQAQQEEAAKVAKMKEQEKIEYERKKSEEKAAETQAQLDAYLLKDEATKVASAEGLPVEMLDLYDFRHVSKEGMPEMVKKAAVVYKESVKQSVLKETENNTPEQHEGGGSGGTPKMPPAMI